MPQTTKRQLWQELLWRKPMAAALIVVTFLSTASWIWDESVQPSLNSLERPKLIELLHHLPWYAWVILLLILFIWQIGEHAYKLIRKAEDQIVPIVGWPGTLQNDAFQ